MLPSRFPTGQSSSGSVRKSRLEVARPSMLPKPRRPASNDRASSDRRPSGAGAGRSNSAEPARATLAVARLSKDSSVSKLNPNRRSKSQQGDRYGQSSMTPLRSSQYNRTTTTPVRTPTEDRRSRSWQVSLDRALAFVTVKDQRPISNIAWQRAELARVSEALALRGGHGAGSLQLIRPLTIARFVDICAQLLNALTNAKLSTDNYVAKLPNLAKRFLYPGAVSKSWLKTVNTLHAFPHALAFISYFLNLVTHVETPVSDEWLYIEKDELARLRREFLNKCWIRFQEPEPEFDDLVSDHLEAVKQLLDYDEKRQRIHIVKQENEELKSALDDPSQQARRAEEERLRSRRDALAAKIRALRAKRAQLRADVDAQRANRDELVDCGKALDQDINGLMGEIQVLKADLSTQTVTVEQRTRLQDEVDYATRVADSKRMLEEQLTKMLNSKETELATWQKRTLKSCVEYQQALIGLSHHLPAAELAVDDTKLMEPECAAAVQRCVEVLRSHLARLSDQRTKDNRARAQHAMETKQRLEEAKMKITELQAAITRAEQETAALEAQEAQEAAAWKEAQAQIAKRLEELKASEVDYKNAKAELEYWEGQEKAWQKRLSEMELYIDQLPEQLSRELAAEKKRLGDIVRALVGKLHSALDAAEAEEAAYDDE